MPQAIQQMETRTISTAIEIARRLGTTINLVLLVAKSLRIKGRAETGLDEIDAARLESETRDFLGIDRVHYYVDGANVLYAGFDRPDIWNLIRIHDALIHLLGARPEEIHIGINPGTAEWMRRHLPDDARLLDRFNGSAWQIVSYDDDLFVLDGLADDCAAMAVSNDGYWNWKRPDRLDQRRVRFSIENDVVELRTPDGRRLRHAPALNNGAAK